MIYYTVTEYAGKIPYLSGPFEAESVEAAELATAEYYGMCTGTPDRVDVVLNPPPSGPRLYC
jgi:hypothetical protein